LIQRRAGGLFHAVNDEGISRYDWTKVILEEAASQQIIPAVPPVQPVLSAFFNSSMRRPDYTVLCNRKLSGELGRALGSWRSGLRKMLAHMK
jgi:dTDP-4-dehydrorhamnose reductase